MACSSEAERPSGEDLSLIYIALHLGLVLKSAFILGECWVFRAFLSSSSSSFSLDPQATVL